MFIPCFREQAQRVPYPTGRCGIPFVSKERGPHSIQYSIQKEESVTVGTGAEVSIILGRVIILHIII